MSREMTPAEFDKFIAETKALGEQLRDELQAVDDGVTESQLAATKPRDPEQIASDSAKHEAAAKESSLAEARAYAETALGILKMLSAAG